MGKINILSFDIANLIAAGEVVERPSSVVKELVENAIDAGATAITVEIRHGGISLIRVSDNGSGIDPDDLPLTVLRHATSKISAAEDLIRIGTLGFRGEALAAIAAVCKLRISTKMAECEMGSVMECEGGEITGITEAGCPNGTTVSASELFYNVPARRKFLKKDATEAAAVTALVERIALSCPGVSLKYVMDGEVRFMTSGDGDLKAAIYAVFGRETALRLSPVERTDSSGIRVHGFAGEPDLVRANKNQEIFYINGRYVRSRTAMAALEQAYMTRIPAGKFPVCVLNIEMNPETVDVNVHPAKLEVKFANERVIFEAVYYAVLNALQANTRPELRFGEQRENPFSIFRDPPKQSTAAPTAAYTARTPDTSPVATYTERRKQSTFSPLQAFAPVETDPEEKPAKLQIPIAPPAEPIVPPAEPTAESSVSPAVEEEIPEYLILGEAYNCYVIVQLADRLLLIDKHAAHERILFDLLCTRMYSQTRRSQVLLFPIQVHLNDEEMLALEEYGEEIRTIGFAIELKKALREAIVSEIPEEISRDGAADMVETLASGLAAGTVSVETAKRKFFEEALFTASCKAAIKGGRIYGEAHLRWICDHLLQTPKDGRDVIKTCPHGRPVAYEISKNTLDRSFDRIQG